MEPFKLKVKIGNAEFDAEGDQETVERQFSAFRELMTNTAVLMPVTPPVAPKPAADPSQPGREISESGDTPEADRLPSLGSGSEMNGESGETVDGRDAELFRPIYRIDKNIISLTALPHDKDGVSKAALLLIYAYRLFNNLEAVGGTALMEGLNVSGFTVDRADRALARYIGGTDPLVIRFGKKRGVKYRLNNRGFKAARQMAEELRKSVM